MLRRALDIGFILQQFLDSKENLLDCDVGLPILLLVQNGQADCARGINVRVREDRFEYTFGGSI